MTARGVGVKWSAPGAFRRSENPPSLVRRHDGGRRTRPDQPASAASVESWIVKTLARPVMRKILSSRSWVQTNCNEPL